MAEYIEREATCEDCVHYGVCYHIEHYGRDIETDEPCEKFINDADVVEVRHGKWNIRSEIHQMLDDVDEELFVECPFCQRRYYVPFEFEDEKILEYAREEYPYCHCGAKMDGEENTK